MNPMNCQHTWETLDDGTQICFECDERKPTPKGRDSHRPERNEMKQLGEIKWECSKGPTKVSGHDWNVTILNGKKYHRIYECRKCGERAEMHKRGFAQ